MTFVRILTLALIIFQSSFLVASDCNPLLFQLYGSSEMADWAVKNHAKVRYQKYQDIVVNNVDNIIYKKTPFSDRWSSGKKREGRYIKAIYCEKGIKVSSEELFKQHKKKFEKEISLDLSKRDKFNNAARARKGREEKTGTSQNYIPSRPNPYTDYLPYALLILFLYIFTIYRIERPGSGGEATKSKFLFTLKQSLELKNLLVLIALVILWYYLFKLINCQSFFNIAGGDSCKYRHFNGIDSTISLYFMALTGGFIYAILLVFAAIGYAIGLSHKFGFLLLGAICTMIAIIILKKINEKKGS